MEDCCGKEKGEEDEKIKMGMSCVRLEFLADWPVC